MNACLRVSVCVCVREREGEHVCVQISKSAKFHYEEDRKEKILNNTIFHMKYKHLNILLQQRTFQQQKIAAEKR